MTTNDHLNRPPCAHCGGPTNYRSRPDGKLPGDPRKWCSEPECRGARNEAIREYWKKALSS